MSRKSNNKDVCDVTDYRHDEAVPLLDGAVLGATSCSIWGKANIKLPDLLENHGLIGTMVECGSNQECPNFEYCFFAEPGEKGMCLGLDCYKQDDCKEGSFCDFSESVGVRTPRGGCAKGSKPPESVLCNRDSMCETSYFCDMTAGPDGNGMCRKRQNRQLHGGITVCYKDIDCPGGRYCDKHDRSWSSASAGTLRRTPSCRPSPRNNLTGARRYLMGSTR
ncbi:hypothetical protein Bbelb_154090 [Branchiostoma belcheri]|nr:hypothetical protein Bbelb_154090 [Branchiostoma belcheri]